ncbi:MAG: hypothetical protein O3C57_05615, partial [Verrucomicrobia bacterium]|nr:hypothetical protein [Verrucomicrobiota bacterium]
MNTQATAAMVRKRIYNVVPSATWQMEQLLGLLSIEMDDAIPTACVDCRSSPRLRLNPSFVAEHCQSDEHLLMLVLHELHHVALGHTRLFPLVTKLHNIAFDAVINAMLCRQFSDSVYTSFFTGLNSAAEFPSRLLRPPEGWPEKSVYPADLSAAERMVMDLLYTDADGSITYLEVFELLVDALAKLAQAGGAKFVLIGSHGDGRNIGKDPLFQKAIDAIIANWPRPKRDLASRDQGASPLDWQLDPRGRPPASARAVLRRLLHRCGVTAY